MLEPLLSGTNFKTPYKPRYYTGISDIILQVSITFTPHRNFVVVVLYLYLGASLYFSVKNIGGFGVSLIHTSKCTFWFFGVLQFTSLPQTPSYSLFVLQFLDRLLLNFKFLKNTCKMPKFFGLTLDTRDLKDEKDLPF